MTITDILKYARNWWWILFVLPILAGASGYLLSSSVTPVYRASATLLVEFRQTGDSAEYNDILASERLARTFSQLAVGRSVLQETIDVEDLAMSVSALSEDITVTPVRDTQLIRVSVEDTDPEQAARIANTLSQVLIGRLADTQRAANIIGQSEVEADLERISAQIDETSARIADIQALGEGSIQQNAAELRRLESLLTHYERTFVSLLEIEHGFIVGAAHLNSGISIAEPATPPTSPFSPRTNMLTALAALLGMLLAGGLVVLLGYIDDTVKSVQDIADLAGRPALGAIPLQAGIDKPITLDSPRSIASEAFRGLRANLQFTSLDQSLRSLIITSVNPGDGKSSTAVNLAIVMAQGGQRVILMDADLRMPRVHTMLTGISNHIGLTSVSLIDRSSPLDDFLQSTNVPRLQVLSTGPLPSNPPDLLISARIGDVIKEAQRHADIVVIDSPPLAVSDSLVLSRWTDGVLLVAASGETRRSDLMQALQKFQQVGSTVLGVVLNKAEARSSNMHAYYAYRDPDPTDERSHQSDDDGPSVASRVGGAFFPKRSRP